MLHPQDLSVTCLRLSYGNRLLLDLITKLHPEQTYQLLPKHQLQKFLHSDLHSTKKITSLQNFSSKRLKLHLQTNSKKNTTVILQRKLIFNSRWFQVDTTSNSNSTRHPYNFKSTNKKTTPASYRKSSNLLPSYVMVVLGMSLGKVWDF